MKSKGKEIPFDVMLEKLENAQLFSEKTAARQSEITRAMENESARQAMKRRKLLYSEGGFPEGKAT